MTQEIDLGGTIYISSRRGAEITGYTQDYIGQLSREGHIEAKRVAGMWYILEESLKAYKEKADLYVPQPPPMPHRRQESEVSVSFDGKEYISAHRAAVITGYHQDYIGQLARSGQVLSRQVGKRWYVDQDTLLSHKKEKESLLAEIQSQSVGIVRSGAPDESDDTLGAEKTKPLTHFNYVEESAPNQTLDKEGSFTEYHDDQMGFAETRETPLSSESEAYKDEEISIPIRVVTLNPVAADVYPKNKVFLEDESPEKTKKPKKRMTRVLVGGTVLVVLGTILYIGYTAGIIRPKEGVFPAENTQNEVIRGFSGKNSISRAEKILRDLLDRELIYKRN